MLRCAALQLDAAKLDALCGAYSHDRKRPGVLTAAELESLPFWLPECRRTVPSVRFAAARCMLHIARCELRVLIKGHPRRFALLRLAFWRLVHYNIKLHGCSPAERTSHAQLLARLPDLSHWRRPSRSAGLWPSWNGA